MEFRTVDSHPGCIVHKVTFGAGIGDYLTQDWLVPVAIETVPAARVPRANHMVAREMPSPTASTTPAPSWPSTIGNG